MIATPKRDYGLADPDARCLPLAPNSLVERLDHGIWVRVDVFDQPSAYFVADLRLPRYFLGPCAQALQAPAPESTAS